MRRIGALVLSAVVLAGPAGAQDPEAAIGREIERRARANEADGGFCARVGADLVRLTRPQAAEQLNRLLARPDGQGATLIFVAVDPANSAPTCAYFVFGPARMRDGKKCRPADLFACLPGQDCRAKLGDSICEVRPGVWD